MPLYRRLPKRGFTNKRFKKHYVTVNVDALMRMDDGAEVTLESLTEAGIINPSGPCDGLKILGGGDLSKKLTVRASVFTSAAKAKIEEAGGSCEVI